MSNSIGRVAEALKGSVGKTFAETALAMTQAVYPPNHPEVYFAQWIVDNSNRIYEACAELGIDAPELGPNLYSRLKMAVMPALKACGEEEKTQ